MNKFRTIMPGIFILAFAIPAAFADDHNDKQETVKYQVDLAPLNSSGVYGEVELVLKGNKLTIEIEASGLEPDKIHPQHIHGIDKPVKNSTCPGLEADSDADGIISVTEGLPAYGPIILPLAPFDLVDASGKLEYEASFTINPGTLPPLHKRVVLIHGMTVNDQYIPSLPIACGEIHRD